MKRPGRLVAASKESEVVDEVIPLSTRDRILRVLKEEGPLSMMKVSILSGIAPRTTRYILTECMGRNIISKSECKQCGSHMTYEIS